MTTSSTNIDTNINFGIIDTFFPTQFEIVLFALFFVVVVVFFLLTLSSVIRLVEIGLCTTCTAAAAAAVH